MAFLVPQVPPQRKEPADSPLPQEGRALGSDTSRPMRTDGDTSEPMPTDAVGNTVATAPPDPGAGPPLHSLTESLSLGEKPLRDKGEPHAVATPLPSATGGS